MKKLLMIGMLAASALPFATAAQAAGHEPYPWCAQYTGRSGNSTNCGFDTVAQCRAAVFGVGGYCAENPIYRHADARRRHRRG